MPLTAFGTAPALAVQQHLMRTDRRSEPLGHTLDRPLERGISERDRAAAAVTDDVMVMTAVSCTNSKRRSPAPSSLACTSPA